MKDISNIGFGSAVHDTLGMSTPTDAKVFSMSAALAKISIVTISF